VKSRHAFVTGKIIWRKLTQASAITKLFRASSVSPANASIDEKYAK